ncbi:MAG: helix-turn-helix transcriptional regulator [Legionella sp.]|jgi:DNA-binding Xre family transcriptional regulator|nr:helix-turn-helix transcriptional regulator [Legionella sp.]
MITSDKQYIAAKEQLHMLTQSLSAPVKHDIPAAIESAGKAQIKELITEIKANINEYESIIKNTHNNIVIEIHSLDDLLAAPIRYRLANHMSIDNFSRKVGVSARQIARYEKEEYQNINARTLQKILKILEVRIDGEIAKAA